LPKVQKKGSDKDLRARKDEIGLISFSKALDYLFKKEHNYNVNPDWGSCPQKTKRTLKDKKK
jgi:hypothetical protein